MLILKVLRTKEKKISLNGHMLVAINYKLQKTIKKNAFLLPPFLGNFGLKTV